MKLNFIENKLFNEKQRESIKEVLNDSFLKDIYNFAIKFCENVNSKKDRDGIYDDISVQPEELSYLVICTLEDIRFIGKVTTFSPMHIFPIARKLMVNLQILYHNIENTGSPHCIDFSKKRYFSATIDFIFGALIRIKSEAFASNMIMSMIQHISIDKITYRSVYHPYESFFDDDDMIGSANWLMILDEVNYKYYMDRCIIIDEIEESEDNPPKVEYHFHDKVSQVVNEQKVDNLTTT